MCVRECMCVYYMHVCVRVRDTQVGESVSTYEQKMCLIASMARRESTVYNCDWRSWRERNTGRE